MKLVIFIGPPGAGKGTQCGLLAKLCGYTHLSTGDLIRKQIASGTEFGLQLKKTVDAGHLVEDSVVVDCLVNQIKTLSSTQSKVILLDGIPRNLTQSRMLDEIFNKNILSVVYIGSDLESLVARFSMRWSCSKCGKVESFPLEFDPQHYTCGQCLAVNSFYKRADDAPEIVRSRFNVYAAQTFPVIDFYRSKGILAEFDALGSIDEIYLQVSSFIAKKLSN